MAKKSNGKPKGQTAERRSHKSDESTEDDEPISMRTRAARLRRPNTEKQVQASRKSRRVQDDESASSDENSSADDSASSEISESESRATSAQDSQANPSTSSAFDTEMPDAAPAAEQGPKSKRKRTRKQDKRVQEVSDSSDEEPASNSNQKGKKRKDKPRETSRREDIESAGEGASGNTQSNWGSTCQQARIDYPIRKKASPDYDKIILEFDPDNKEEGPLEVRIRYVLDYRGYLFVTGPSRREKYWDLERAWLLKGNDHAAERERFLGVKSVTHVAKAEVLRDIPPGRFRWNNVAMTLDGMAGVVEGYGDYPEQELMYLLTLPSVKSRYGATESDNRARVRRGKVGQGPLLSNQDLKAKRAAKSLKI